jgi:hypothetical protein
VNQHRSDPQQGETAEGREALLTRQRQQLQNPGSAYREDSRSAGDECSGDRRSSNRTAKVVAEPGVEETSGMVLHLLSNLKNTQEHEPQKGPSGLQHEC